MVELFDELSAQPQGLRDMANFYREHPEILMFPPTQPEQPWVLTGMGASYHAAWIGALAFGSFGMTVQAIETVDLIHYSRLPEKGGWTVYVSQSGSSGEVTPFFERFPNRAAVAALTNTQDSKLAHLAGRCLPMCAGDETLIASKTFINSVGILWMLARRAAGAWDGSEIGQLEDIAVRVDSIFAAAATIRERFLAFYDPAFPLLFLGHGPHAATARQAAMGMSEWAKVPALHTGLGAYRHGFIESVLPGLRVIVFAPPGVTQHSAHSLASELNEYGAKVLLIENGTIKGLNGTTTPEPGVDEFLSPILDILPVQIAADWLVQTSGMEPGFHYISKVVRQL